MFLDTKQLWRVLPPLCLLAGGSIFAEGSESPPLLESDFSLVSPPEVPPGEWILEEIAFEGNHSLSEKELKRVMRSREGKTMNRFLLNWDLRRVERLYFERGFQKAKVIHQREEKNLEEKTLSYTFTIEEGPLTVLGEVKIAGDHNLDRGELEKRVWLHPGDPLLQEKIDLTRMDLLTLYEDRGYLYAEVKPLVAKKEENGEDRKGEERVVLTFEIVEGALVEVEGVAIEGNETVRDAIISREVLVKAGENYSPRKAYESQKRIYGTGLFKDVKFVLEGREEEREKVRLLFKVKEAKPRWFGFGGGLRSSEWLLLRGEWGHNNLFDNGQRLSIRGSYSPNLKLNGAHLEDLELFYVEPYFLSTPYTGILRMYLSRIRTFNDSLNHLDPQLTETGGGMRVGRDFGLTYHGYTEFKFKKSFGEEVSKTDDYTNSLLFSLARDTRPNRIDPLRGHLLSLSSEFAGGLLGGDNNFTRHILEGTYYTKAVKGAIFASRMKGGVIFPFKGKEVPFHEGFELKGGNVIRGLEERRQSRENIYKVLGTLNLELRFPVYKRLWAGYFVDMGGLWREVDQVDWESGMLGAGFGLRYNFAIGPLRVDYGHPIKDPEKSVRGKIYFSIGHLF